MRKAIVCFLSTALSVFILNAGAVETSSTTRIEKQHHVFDASSRSGMSVISWLRQRKSEGQISSILDQNVAANTVFTIDVETTTKTNRTGVASGVQNEAFGNDFGNSPGSGVTLPTQGTPGEKITITTCEPGVGTTSETYTWTVGSNGQGYWKLSDVQTHLTSSTKCIGP